MFRQILSIEVDINRESYADITGDDSVVWLCIFTYLDVAPRKLKKNSYWMNFDYVEKFIQTDNRELYDRIQKLRIKYAHGEVNDSPLVKELEESGVDFKEIITRIIRSMPEEELFKKEYSEQSGVRAAGSHDQQSNG